MARRRLKITPVLMALNVLVLILIVLFYVCRMVKYYLQENGNRSNGESAVLLVDTILKKQSYVDLTKGLVYVEDRKEYRYIGDISDNYLEYSGIVYRIIGIDKDNNIKAITDKSVTLMYSGLEKGYDKSYINKWLNYNKDVKLSGFYENNIKESVNYLANTYLCKDVIDDVKNITCDKEEANNKITILSLYDYYKAGGKSSFLNNGETFYLATNNKDNHNYYITNDGEVSINEMTSKVFAVRPVITISSGTVMIGGKGSKDDPYKILEVNPSTLEEATINTYVKFSDQTFKIIHNYGVATKVALDGVIQIDGKDAKAYFSKKNNIYSSNKNTVGEYLNKTYINTLNKDMMVNAYWFTGKQSLDNLDYEAERASKDTDYIGMMTLTDMFIGEYNDILTLSRGIESNQIINIINKDGNFYGDLITNKHNVRPVFYLNKELKITGGSGTADAPYELGESDEKN